MNLKRIIASALASVITMTVGIISNQVFEKSSYISFKNIVFAENADSKGIKVEDVIVGKGSSVAKLGIYFVGDSIIGGEMEITCDTPLKCVSVNGGMANSIVDGVCTLVVGSSFAISPNKPFAILTIEIPDNTQPGIYPVNLKVRGLYGFNGEIKNPDEYNGSVTIDDAPVSDSEMNALKYLDYESIDSDEDGTTDCVTITGCDKTAVNIAIPLKINGLPVTNIKNGAFLECAELESIVISDNITSIGEYAFTGCKKITNIEIPQSVSKIGMWAFSDCPQLETVSITNPECEIIDSFFTIEDIVTIRSYKYSTAEVYAKNNKIKFEAIGGKTEIKGDVNGDSKVTIADIVAMQKYLIIKKFEYTYESDLNDDEVVDVFDLIALKRVVIGNNNVD